MFYYRTKISIFKLIIQFDWHLKIYITLRPQSSSRRRNFFRRRFRETHPKKRVPRTRFLRFIRRTTLFSAELDVPSRNIVDFRARVISARWIWLTLTLRIRRSCLIDTRIKSPGYAIFRLNPPSVLIHSTKRAPELSIVFSQDWTWIIWFIKNLN